MSCEGNEISSANQINRDIFWGRQISSEGATVQIIENQTCFLSRNTGSYMVLISTLDWPSPVLLFWRNPPLSVSWWHSSFGGGYQYRDYIASHCRIIDKWRIVKDSEGIGRCLIEVSSQRSPEGIVKKAMKNLILDIPTDIQTQHLPNISSERCL
jgi:hypothetical protein